MDRFDAIVNGYLSKATEKKEALERKAKAKKDYLDPEFAFNINNIDYVDADSVIDRNTGQEIRITGEGGRGYDSYESIPQGYDINPLKEMIHKRSYADAYGLRVDQVTREMLLAKGKVQSNQFKARLAEAADENGNIRYRHKGRGQYGRVLAEISYDGAQQKLLDDMGSRDENAGYKGDFNFMRELEDFESGDTVQHNQGRGERSWKDALLKDQAVNLTYGAGEMVNSLGQAVAIGTGLGKQTAEFFEGNRESLKGFKNKYGSEEMLRGERMAQNRAELRKNISSMKKAQYVAQGDSELEAGIKAGISEFGDTLVDFWDNPGRALDSAVTSLPYMIGVGGVGSQTARIASNQLRKKMAVEFTEFAARGKAVGALEKETIERTTGDYVKKFMTSKAAQDEITAIVEKVGIGTVGLTEGMTNSADVYSEIMRMTEEEASQSHEYNKLREAGKSHVDALHELGVSAWAETLVTTAVLATAAAAGTGAGAFEANMFRGFRKIAKPAPPASAVVRTTGPGGRFVPTGAKVPNITKTPKPAATAAEIRARAKNIKKIGKERTAEELGLKKSLLSSVASGTKATGKVAGRVLKEPAKAGGKELVEETIQSGGGELVSQIATQEATGKEVGPGVGTAAAEGAVVGFISGFGMSSITNVVKKGAQKILKSASGPEGEIATDHSVPIDGGGGSLIRLGGSTEQLDATLDSKNYNPEVAETELKKILAALDADKTNQNIFDHYNALTRHFIEAAPRLVEEYNKALAAGDIERANEIATIKNEVARYEGVYHEGIANTLRKNSDDYINGKMDEGGKKTFESIIEEASINGLDIPAEIVEKLDQNTKNILSQNNEMNALLKKLQDPTAIAEAIQAEIAASGVDPDSEEGKKLALTLAQVHATKMGAGRFMIPGTRAKHVRGVKRFIQDLSGAMQEDPKLGVGHVTTIIAQFDNFLQGQQNKIDQLKDFIKNPPENGTYQLHVDPAKPDSNNRVYKFSEGGAQRMLNAMVAEQTHMEGIQASFKEKRLAYEQRLKGIEGVAPETTGTTETETVPPTKLETVKASLSKLSRKSLMEQAKKRGVKFKEGIATSALVQMVAQWIVDLENNPEGSDAGDDDFRLSAAERAKADTFTVKEESGGAFLKRIGPALESSKPGDVLTTASQNTKRTVQAFLRNRGYIRDRKTQAGNTVWTYSPNYEGNPLAYNAPKKVARPPSLLESIARGEGTPEGISGLNKEQFSEHLGDYTSADKAGGRQIAKVTGGMDRKQFRQFVQDNVQQSTLSGYAETDENVDIANAVLEDLLDPNGSEDLVLPKYADQLTEYQAYEDYAAQTEQADQQLEAELPQQGAEQPVRASAKGSEGTTNEQPTPTGTTQTPPPAGTHEAGVAKAQSVYADAVANNDNMSADEVSEALRAGRKGLTGPAKRGYMEREQALFDKHVNREEGPTDSNIFNETYTALREAFRTTQAHVNAAVANFQDWQNYLVSLRNSDLPRWAIEDLKRTRINQETLNEDTEPQIIQDVFEREGELLQNIVEGLLADYPELGYDITQRLLNAFTDTSTPNTQSQVNLELDMLSPDPESVEADETGPIGQNSTLFALRKNTREKLTKTITAIKEDLGESKDAKLLKELKVAQDALKALDDPHTNARELQQLISTIEQAVQARLTSEDAYIIANKSHYFKNALMFLAEMGMDGSQTKEFIQQRDALLDKLLAVISKDARDGVDIVSTSDKITTTVWNFINAHPTAAPNAFLAGGVRFKKGMGLESAEGPVIIATANKSLPTRLNDSYTKSGTKPISWLSIYPNWRTKLKSDYVKMDPDDRLFAAVGAFIHFEEKFRTTLLTTMVKWGPDSVSKKSLWAYNSEFFTQRLLEDPPSWYFRDQQGNLNENLITAMALEAFKYVSGAGQRTSYNDAAEIANILKEHKGYTPNADEIKGLSTVGDGIENVYDLIGNELMKHLNIKSSGLSTGQLRSVMPRALASRTVSTLALMGMVDIRAVDIEEIRGNEPNADRARKFVRLKSDEEQPGNTSTSFTWDVQHLIETGVALNREGKLVEMFGTAATAEGPSLTPFENVETKIRKTVMTAPAETTVGTKADQDRPLTVNGVLQTAAKLFPTGEHYLQVNHNYATSFADIHASKVKNIKGRNSNFLRDWNSAVNWISTLAELGATQFYVPNRNITNLRTMIVSIFVNTQASKVHRPLFPKAEAMLEYAANMTPETARNNPEATAFYRSVVQKLGGKLRVNVGGKEQTIKVEYLTDEQVLDNVQALISDPKWQNLIDHINDPQETLEDGRKVFSQDQLNDFLAAELYNEEKGETYMTLANLAALQKAQDAPWVESPTIKMYQPVQVDSTTSGFANSSMQLVTKKHFPKFKLSLQRIGAAFRGDPTTATEYRSNNNDSYQTITALVANAMKGMVSGYASEVDQNGNVTTTPLHVKLAGLKTALKKLQQGADSEFMDEEVYNRKEAYLRKQIRIYSMQSNARLLSFGSKTLGEIGGKYLGIIPELIEADGKITSAGRQFAKDPFMLGNYNAGRTSAKRALASNSYSELLDLLATIDDAATLQGAIEVLYEARNEAVPIMYESGDLTGDQVKLIPPKDIAAVAADVVKTLETTRANNYTREERRFGEHRVVNLGTLLTFPPAQEKVYKTIISDTYGEALHVALDAELFHLREPRDGVHQMAFISNAIFQEILDKRVKDFKKANYGIFPDYTQIKYLVDQLVNEGLFPGIPSAVSKEMNDRIEGVKRLSTALYIDGAIVRGDIGFEGKQAIVTDAKLQEALTFVVEDRQFSDNPGVAPAVRVVQSIEAVIQSDLLTEYAFTNTYDGQGAEGTLARVIGKAANESAIKRNYEYNMFDAMFNTMVSTMRALHPTSAQLSEKSKEMLLKTLASKYGGKGDTAQEAFDSMLGQLKRVQTDIHEGRRMMWEQMMSLNNYMESNLSEVNVASVLNTVAPVPTIYDKVNPTLEELTVAYNDFITNVDQNGVREEVKTKMTTALVNGFSNGINADNGAVTVVQQFMRANPKGNRIGLGYLMDLLKDSLKASGGNANLTGLVNQLYSLMKDVPAIRGIQIHLSNKQLTGHDGKVANATYTPRMGNNPARIDVWDAAPEFFSSTLHEIVHAITGNYIDEAENQAPGTFQAIVGQAIEAARIYTNLPKTFENGPRRMLGAILTFELERGTVQGQKNAVSEMISYVTTEFTENKEKTDIDVMPFLEEFNVVLESLKTLIAAAAPEIPVNRQAQASAIKTNAQQGMPLLHENSSSEDIDTVAFLERYVTQLPGEQIKQVLDDVAKYETDPESLKHNQRLDFVIENIIKPGLDSVDPLIVKISQNKDGERNLGQVIGSTVYLEAAGNRLTANIDMSMKEVVTHEYLHPIVRWALGQQTDASGKRDPGHWDIQQRLKKLFEVARENIKPLDLMPLAPTGDIVYAQQQARERYDYIFNNPKGDMSEFLINGLVNERLIELLAEMDAPNTTQPIWEGPSYKTLANIMGRIMRLFTKKVNKSLTGKIDKELQVLAASIVGVNFQNMQRNLHKQRSQPRMDTVNGWLTDQIGQKVAEPLKKHVMKFKPSQTDSTAKRATYNAVTLMLNAADEDFQKSAQEYFRELGGQKNNHIMELAAELMPSQKSLVHWKEMLRKSNHVVDRARRSAIEHMQKAIRQHFDPSIRRKLRKADKAALTHVGMRADLSALLGANNNFERLQRLVNSPSAVEAEIVSREAELEQVTQGDTELYNIFRNQTLGLSELMIIGQTSIANAQQNPYMIANQNFFSDAKNKKALADVDGAIKIIDELKTLYALRLINETAPQDMQRFADVVNHEMSRNIPTPNGFQMFMSRHQNFKETALKRQFKGNPAMMNSGYVYEQYNPDIDIKFTTHDPADIKKMEDRNYHRIGILPRDPRDPNQEPMIIWKGLNGHAMYMKTVVSYTDTEARGHDPFDSLKLLNGMDTSTAATLSKYNINIMKQRNEADVLKQMKNPDVRNKTLRSVPVHDENGNITNYRYMMSQNNKKGILEANQDFDYLLGRMFGSLEDREGTIEINRKTAKLLYEEYSASIGKDKTLRFVEISKYSKDPKVREMWELMPADLRKELTGLFGSEHFYIRDDAIKLVLGFRKLSLAREEWFGKHTFAVRAAERVWFDVIKLLKIKIVLTMPDVVLGNMASNIALLAGQGIPPEYITRETMQGLKGISMWMKDEETLFALEQEMQSTARAQGTATARQIAKRAELKLNMANNPIAKLAEEGVFTGIADELEPDTWNWRNRIMQWVGEASDSFLPAAVVSGVKELMVVPGSQTFKAALAATQYADFVARHVQYKYDTEVRGRGEEEALQDAIDNFIYYDVPQNEWMALAEDYGFAMFLKYFFRIQQRIFRLYKNHPVSATGTLAVQKMMTNYPFSSNVTDYAFLDNFNFQSRLHMFPWRTMDSADMLTPALLHILMYPFGGGR